MTYRRDAEIGEMQKILAQSESTGLTAWRGYFGFCETPEVLIALSPPLIPALR